ncbi:MAG TPA: MarC family protein [Thermoanaerobaculia bacterium]|nr:MarC family protein [Thermoanaerobaculia bacterium]
MPLWKVSLLSFAALITMVNPLAVVPAFVALTDRVSRSRRARVALVAAISCTVVLTVFFLAGNYVFQFFGITIPAFQIMGGILFLSNGLRTLVSDERRVPDVGGEKRMEDQDVAKAEIDPSSIAIVPLAVPLLSGPGAITSVMVLVNLYPGIEQKGAVLAAIAGIGAVSYVVLLAALPLSRIMGNRGRAVFSKIMALLLGAIGVQFIINGITPVAMQILKG